MMILTEKINFSSVALSRFRRVSSVVLISWVDIRYVTSDIAKHCFKNNINEFDIHKYEPTLIENLKESRSDQKINDAKTLLETIGNIFLENIEHDGNDEFVRLKNQAARNFYSLVLSWKMRGASFKEMIAAVLRHWEERLENAKYDQDYKIYVGHSWGEVKRSDEEFVYSYIDLREKTRAQKVNVAIVRIKEEQDFVEYNLMKYIEVLNDLEMLDENFYEQIKYGSSDKKTICLLKNGISMELAKCLLNGKYNLYLGAEVAKTR